MLQSPSAGGSELRLGCLESIPNKSPCREESTAACTELDISELSAATPDVEEEPIGVAATTGAPTVRDRDAVPDTAETTGVAMLGAIVLVAEGGAVVVGVAMYRECLDCRPLHLVSRG